MNKNVLILAILVLSAFNLYAQTDSGFQIAKSGLLYKIISDSKGEKLKPGQFIKFNAIVKLKDSVTYSSYGKIPAFTSVDSTGQPYDLSEIIPLLRAGDSAIVVQLADTIAKLNMGNMPPGLQKGDKIKISIRILEVLKDMDEAMAEHNKETDRQKKKEELAVEAYLLSNNIIASKTELGTYVEMINPGTGAKPDSGKKVSIKYTGMNFDGKKFDSNVDPEFLHTEPYEFTIGEMSAIPGFEDGIKQIAKGGKAKVYIPSMLAYGAQGSPPTVQPYENLIFEVELLNITSPVKPKPKPKPVVTKKAAVKKKVTPTKKPVVKPKPKTTVKK